MVVAFRAADISLPADLSLLAGLVLSAGLGVAADLSVPADLSLVHSPSNGRRFATTAVDLSERVNCRR